VVYVYQHHPSWMAYAYDEGMSAAQVEAARRSIQEAAEEANQHAHRVVDRMIDDAKIGGSVPTTKTVIEGHRPAEELVLFAADADLLVFGSCGRGGFVGLLLGSVSQQCATHAKCPVSIIRPKLA
jgi:nucleotide-binding universal stress UspA family protein